MSKRLATFWRGLRSMRPSAGFDWYWKLGPFLEWTPPSAPKSKGVAFHFEKMGVAIGPLWVGFRDSD